MDEAVYFGWGWFALGISLAIVGALLSLGWFQVVAIPAILNAILFALTPFGFSAQLIVFCVGLSFSSLVYLYWFYVPLPKNATQKQIKIAPKTIGMQASLIKDVRIGKGKAQLKDAVWTVRCDKMLPVGSLVVVTGFSGAELEVAPVKPGAA